MALFQARLALIACAAALLAACASPPPPPPVVQVAPVRPVIIDTADYSAGRADDVLFRAIGLVGTPYRWGGNTPAAGFDCSGLIDFVYRDAAGIALPRTTGEMLDMPKQSINRRELRSGDLVFFSTQGGRRVSHAGIYVGEGRFVHAPRTGGTVRLDYLDKPYWAKAYLDAKRIIEPQRLANNP